MLSFIRAMDAFEVPVLLGLPAKVFVFSNRIYAAVQYDYPVNYGLATALGVSFFVLMIGLLYLQNRVLGGRSFFVVTGKGYQPRIVKLGRFKYVTLAVCLLYFIVGTGLPLSQVMVGSFQRVFGLPTLEGFTFGNYAAILTDLALWRPGQHVRRVRRRGGSLRRAVHDGRVHQYTDELRRARRAGRHHVAAVGDSWDRRRPRDAVGVHHAARAVVRHADPARHRVRDDGPAAWRAGHAGRDGAAWT
jgi:ABC-type sugar transport system permease subunit